MEKNSRPRSEITFVPDFHAVTKAWNHGEVIYINGNRTSPHKMVKEQNNPAMMNMCLTGMLDEFYFHLPAITVEYKTPYCQIVK